MDADRTLKHQKGQALMELLLLAPLFLTCVLAVIFFTKTLNARLALIHVCRDTALALGRDPATDDPQSLVQSLVQRRGLQSLGAWSAESHPAIPGGEKEPAGILGSILGAVVAERLTVTLQMSKPRWLPGSPAPWIFRENVTFKRGTWKAPYAKALESIMHSK